MPQRLLAQPLLTDPRTTFADILLNPPELPAPAVVAAAAPAAPSPAQKTAASVPLAPAQLKGTRVAAARAAISRRQLAHRGAGVGTTSDVQALGYARPDDPLTESRANAARVPWPGMGKKVAFYDISAQRVYMPDGEVLEAHSGQGPMRDNPNYVNVKMRGPTPPSTYRLSMRESLFHGVEALRLTPVDGVNPHGRVGLLTHSYLRRRPGDSAGCVAFKNYPRFLNAFKRGQITHLVIVSSLDRSSAPGAKVASLSSRGR